MQMIICDGWEMGTIRWRGEMYLKILGFRRIKYDFKAQKWGAKWGTIAKYAVLRYFRDNVAFAKREICFSIQICCTWNLKHKNVRVSIKTENQKIRHLSGSPILPVPNIIIQWTRSEMTGRDYALSQNVWCGWDGSHVKQDSTAAKL